MERLKNELANLEIKLKELGAPMTYRNKIEDIRVSIRWAEAKESGRV
jgi:hypothetical protein